MVARTVINRVLGRGRKTRAAEMPPHRPRSVDWDRYGGLFVEDEFRCSHTGRCDMQADFMDRLYSLRLDYGRPMVIASGYRHVSHPIETQKPRPGSHTFGRAADISVSHADAVYLLELALKHGFTGFGVAQKGGSGRFLHLDDMDPSPMRPRPTIWSY